MKKIICSALSAMPFILFSCSQEEPKFSSPTSEIKSPAEKTRTIKNVAVFSVPEKNLSTRSLSDAEVSDKQWSFMDSTNDIRRKYA